MTEENKYLIEDWWTNSQIKLVKDASKVWIKKAFETISGFWIKVDGAKVLGKTSEHTEIPPDAIIDNRAWDHEHCYLCFETISDHGNYQREGYTDGKNWLCIECYNKYILSQPTVK